MKGIQFAITVLVYVGILFVLQWLFGKYDLTYGAIKHLYFQMLGYGFCLYFMIVLYEQRLTVIGWPKWLSFAPVLYIGALFYFKDMPHLYKLALHAAHGLFFLMIAFKGPKRSI